MENLIFCAVKYRIFECQHILKTVDLRNYVNYDVVNTGPSNLFSYTLSEKNFVG